MLITIIIYHMSMPSLAGKHGELTILWVLISIAAYKERRLYINGFEVKRRFDKHRYALSRDSFVYILLL